MQLKFEIIKEVGSGNCPDLLHFPNTDAQLFYVEDGRIHGLFTNNIDNGEWGDLTLKEISKLFPDENVSNFELTMFHGFGAIGGYKTNDTHKLVIYRRDLENN